MLANVGLYSYATALLAYTVLSALVFLDRRTHPVGWPLLLACVLTTVWAGIIAGSTLLDYPRIALMQLSEVARNAAWSVLLLKLIQMRLQQSDQAHSPGRWLLWLAVGYGVVVAILFGTPWLLQALSLPEHWQRDLSFSCWLAMSVAGLLLLEQIFRNSTEGGRWSSKFLCLGLGFLFAFDFFMYAQALLFRQLDATLWQARGILVALTAVFVGISMRRTDGGSLQVSRHVAFHSVTLLAAGIYLILMATVGYFIRYLGGTWGGVLQITFLCASGLLLLALMFSGQIRARTRVWLSKNFFSYKYDYRVEWLQFTRTLSEGGENIPENIVRAIAHITQSPAGLLWSRTEDGQFVFTCHWQMAEPEPDDKLQALPLWLQQTQWIIDLQEWRRAPDVYQHLQLPDFILAIPRAWLIIPLIFGERLQGIVLLRESDLQPDINWEDRDLLKVAGCQAASYLAQYQASRALVESRQFEAFNRLSAYVVHDLKNILAQQSLIVSNAAKHRNNPDFVEDVINTVGNSVERMTRLMEQMRSGVRGIQTQQIALHEVIQEAVASRRKALPQPQLLGCDQPLTVQADREQLLTVFTHIIQNAQEASSKTGRVAVRVREPRDGRVVVEIDDDGVGMDEAFVRNRLFTPFDSTKGLTGMGIGAFESREFVRSLGGDIQVTSTPGKGSRFRIVLPCASTDTDVMDANKECSCEQE
ncbi:MAG: PEP-CTERM system histidine kinase PrsK [Halioglobus sp.]|nr:PEP-CTERM system histidine kinase PrsK [Halioglobus sp.]